MGEKRRQSSDIEIILISLDFCLIFVVFLWNVGKFKESHVRSLKWKCIQCMFSCSFSDRLHHLNVWRNVIEGSSFLQLSHCTASTAPSRPHVHHMLSKTGNWLHYTVHHLYNLSSYTDVMSLHTVQYFNQVSYRSMCNINILFVQWWKFKCWVCLCRMYCPNFYIPPFILFLFYISSHLNCSYFFIILLMRLYIFTIQKNKIQNVTAKRSFS